MQFSRRAHKGGRKQLSMGARLQNFSHSSQSGDEVTDNGSAAQEELHEAESNGPKVSSVKDDFSKSCDKPPRERIFLGCVWTA